MKTGENEKSSISIQMKLGDKFTILEEMKEWCKIFLGLILSSINIKL